MFTRIQSRIFILFVFLAIVSISEGLPFPLYTESEAYHENYGHGHASATAGVGKIEGSKGPLNGHAMGPEVGAHAFGGLNGVGYGVRATAGEIEGRIGGALGVGGKLGLSADTSVQYGQDGIGAYVLGTGVSFTGKKGFEICFLGSCLSIG